MQPTDARKNNTQYKSNRTTRAGDQPTRQRRSAKSIPPHPVSSTAHEKNAKTRPASLPGKGRAVCRSRLGPVAIGNCAVISVRHAEYDQQGQCEAEPHEKHPEIRNLAE